jgi:prepilin-type N-terminal cleavage/methylation domain-containing protein
MRRSNRKGGFTMIEVMIAVAIIGVLASVAIPAFQNYQNRSRRAEAFANLGAIAKLEKSYYSEYGSYVSVGVSEPAGVPSSTKLLWDPAADVAFGVVGFHPDGAVYYTYAVNVDLGQCPRQDCFTASAYGDADSDGLMSLVMYVQPTATGQTSPDITFPALGLPLDPISNSPRTNEVAVNYQADLY